MKAVDLYEFFKVQGKWVNWQNTNDHILFGNPDIEIKKIAVAWKPSIENLKRAVDLECNLFITHEPLYLAFKNQFGVVTGGSARKYDEPIEGRYFLEEDDIWLRKKEWLESVELTVMRCHDFWDDFPEIGIHGAWAKWLGFTEKPIEQQKFYEIHSLGEITLKQLLEHLHPRLKSLGQPIFQYIGKLDQKVNRIALGTGAITDYRIMYSMGADCLLLTDDGTRLWESAQFSIDSGVPIIIVNHAVAEEPGIRMLAEYISRNFPELCTIAIKEGCLTNFWGGNLQKKFKFSDFQKYLWNFSVKNVEPD